MVSMLPLEALQSQPLKDSKSSFGKLNCYCDLKEPITEKENI
jgi:hypothetical protein